AVLRTDRRETPARVASAAPRASLDSPSLLDVSSRLANEERSAARRVRSSDEGNRPDCLPIVEKEVGAKPSPSVSQNFPGDAIDVLVITNATPRGRFRLPAERRRPCKISRNDGATTSSSSGPRR